MKKILFILTSFICLHSQAQVIADPSLEQISFTDFAGNAITDTMPIGYIAELNIPIRNLDGANAIPNGSCKLKIGLGSKLILDPNFIVSLAATSDYFDWSAAFIGGQIQITGELRVSLPPDYSGIAKFNVMGNLLDYSTITTNFLVTNHNSPVILSDGNPSNNTSFRQYKIIPPVTTPVDFVNITAVNTNCSVNVSFATENEINVSHFDIEYSKNGTSYSKAGSLDAARLANYAYRFPITSSIAAELLYIRIKSVDRNGTYKYSTIKTINALCGKKSSFILYPNPVTNEEYVTVRAITTGIAERKYKAFLFDAAGRLVSTKDVVIDNQQQFTYSLKNVAAGQYLLKLSTLEGVVTETFVIQKHK